MFNNMTAAELLAKGGLVFAVILLISVLVVTVIIERAIAYRCIQTKSRKFLAHIHTLVYANNFDEATELCKTQNSFVATIVLSALERRGKSRDVITQAVERAGSRLDSALNQRLGILASAGSVTPFIGLFGTVLGIINAFQSMSAATTYSPALVSSGIAEALVNTAAGLFVAVPSVLAYNYFITRSEQFLSDIEYATSELVELLSGENQA